MAEKEVRYKTPAGIAHYPWLNKPDEYKGKKHWKTGLILKTDSPECGELKDLIDGLVEEAFDAETASLKKKDRAEARKHFPYEILEDDNEDPTGEVRFDFKRTAEYMDKKTGEAKPIYINFFNKAGKFVKMAEVTDKIGKIGGGSTIQCEFESFPFYNAASGKAGISMRLTGVRVIEIREFEGGNTWGDEEEGAPEDPVDF